MESLEIYAAIIMGFLGMILVALHPSAFWPALIIVNIVGNGPRLMGYFFWDELLTGSILLGALAHIATYHGAKEKSEPSVLVGHSIVFGIWASYMVMESVIGVIANDDIRIVRWILFYALLGVLSSIASGKTDTFPFPSPRQMALIVLPTTVLYYIAYLAHGVIIEAILDVGGQGRFAAQFLTEGFLWSGSAIAVFPSLLAMPVAVLFMNDRSPKMRALSWVAIFAMMLVALYYDSRISWVVIFGVLLVRIRHINVMSVAIFVLCLIVVIYLFIPNLESGPLVQLWDLVSVVFEGTQALWAPGESDVTRQLQFHAALLRVSDNLRTFVIGDGTYSHRFTIAPYINDLYLDYLPEQKFVVPGHKETRDDEPGSITLFRTTGFSALIIDSGILGMILLLLNFIAVGHKVYRNPGTDRFMFLFMVAMAFMWLFNNNITEIVLLYLLIMPRGIIEQFSKSVTAPSRLWSFT